VYLKGGEKCGSYLLMSKLKTPIKLIASIFFVLALAVGCSKDDKLPKNVAVETDVRGEWLDDETYRNEFFGFTFKQPNGWVVQKEELSIDQLIEDTEEGRSVRNGAKYVHSPFSVGKAGGLGSNYNLVIENISRLDYEGVDDYIDRSVDSVKNTIKADFKILERKKMSTYLGVEWSSVLLETRMNGLVYYQKMYGVVKQGNVLLLSVTSLRKNDDELNRAIETSLSFTGE